MYIRGGVLDAFWGEASGEDENGLSPINAKSRY